MRILWGATFAGVMALTLAGCSQSAVIEKMTTPEDRALAINVAEAVCASQLAQYRDQMTPQLWSDIETNIASLFPYCPNGKGKSRLVGYQFNTQNVNGVSGSQQQYVVMTESPGKWTRTSIMRISENGGPLLIHGISMDATKEKPADLAQVDKWEANLIWIRLGAAAILVALIAGVVWLVMRSKKKKETGSEAE